MRKLRGPAEFREWGLGCLWRVVPNMRKLDNRAFNELVPHIIDTFKDRGTCLPSGLKLRMTRRACGEEKLRR